MNFQMVIFTLDNNEYGVDISCVQEIIRIPEQITKIPNVPSYVEGIFNLRGKLIYVIDLKKRFHLESIDRSVDSRILILKLDELMVGIITDDVSEVLRIGEESLEKICSELGGGNENYIGNICKIGERLILFLDANRLKFEIFDSMVSKLGVSN